jgi:catechol 2,3-dioxygenase-like lactoylglutathione lyase family enzyme
VLGLREQFRLTNDQGLPWLWYVKVADGQFIELFPTAKGSHEKPGGAGVVHICLQVDNVQKTYSDMAARGLVARGEPKLGADGSWQFWTSDPDGNPIEFHQFTAVSMQR